MGSDQVVFTTPIWRQIYDTLSIFIGSFENETKSLKAAWEERGYVKKIVKCLSGNPKDFKYFSGKLPPNDDIEWIYLICR